MSRRVLTRSTIDQMIVDSVKEYQLDSADIVTPLAKEYAQQRGVRLIPADAARVSKPVSMDRADRPAASAAAAPSPGAAPTPEPSIEPISDHAAVRKAVIAAVGYEPSDLDAIISRVMR